VRMDFHCSETWLDLPAFRVISQVLGPHPLDWPLERRDDHLVCPRCQTCCSRGTERRPRGIRDLPILEHPVMLWLPIRRFRCPNGRHRPWETRTTFGEQVRWTERLYTRVREAYLRGGPCRERAHRSGRSERPVLRWTFARSRGGRPRKLGRAMGMDAYARRTGHHSNTLIVAWATGQPMTTCKGRGAEEVIAWVKSRPQAERESVAVVVVDRSKPCFAAIKEGLGDKVQVIDRFHVVQQAVDALDEVVRAGHKQLAPAEAKAVKKLRKRWLKSADPRHGDEWIARYEWRRRFPALREAIDWVQDLRKWFERIYEKPAREAL
jgi:transposase